LQPIDEAALAALTAEAAASPRKRMNRNLHASPEEPVQRMLNAMEPGTYIPPHRHNDPPRWELLVLLRGEAACLTFDDAGTVTARHELEPGHGLELAAGTWHTLVARASGTVLLEVKEGPYRRPAAEDFAPWAPAEGAEGAANMAKHLETAEVGGHPGPAG
jgi:cupin fold WbuC family metalloprotein